MHLYGDGPQFTYYGEKIEIELFTLTLRLSVITVVSEYLYLNPYLRLYGLRFPPLLVASSNTDVSLDLSVSG